MSTTNMPSLEQLQAAMHWWNAHTQEEKNALCDKHRGKLRSAAEIARFWISNHKAAVNESIRDMLGKRGFYILADTSVPDKYCLAEVEADGTVHQLDLQGQRDGVLAADGWKPTAVAHGPFVTADDAERFIDQSKELL